MLEFIARNAATIATLFFFATFCYVIYYSFKKGNKKKFDEMAKIPLQEKD